MTEEKKKPNPPVDENMLFARYLELFANSMCNCEDTTVKKPRGYICYYDDFINETFLSIGRNTSLDRFDNTDRIRFEIINERKGNVCNPYSLQPVIKKKK